MIRAYEAVINADKKLVNGEIFNAGWENKGVNRNANDVKNVIGEM